MTQDVTERRLWCDAYMYELRRCNYPGEAKRVGDAALKAYREAFHDVQPPEPYDPESPEAIAARVLAGVDGTPTEWFKPGEP